MLAKVTEFVKKYQSEMLLSVAIIAITVISFNLGKISATGTARIPMTITTPNPAVEPLGSGLSGSTAQKPKDPTVVASKAASSKLYHFTWCSGAKRIAAKNKITFPNEAAAIAAGYTLAGNCQK